MSQIASGIRQFLNLPIPYEVLQSCVGAKNARTRFIKEYVQPFAGARILDIGCGTGRILEYLPVSTEYVGLDLNPKYIAYAQNKYKTRAQFYCADVSELTNYVPKFTQFDIILTTAILHHLEDNEVSRLFENLYEYLKERGKIMTFDPTFVPNQSWLAKYIISKDRGQNVRTPEEYIRLIKNRFSSIETYLLNDLLLIPYNHCILRIMKN
jgi:2-polyprenyl-3-methyl-5-hydroxy-6-metoxy-1,4-benzoquinol methylase